MNFVAKPAMARQDKARDASTTGTVAVPRRGSSSGRSAVMARIRSGCSGNS
ncbi:MAG: hypothetical protein HQL56_13570 [Magnetococcales bacterium]|nr:hypothetical protein [Magnetococcales bacterium]